MTNSDRKSRFVVYATVLPAYRRECLDLLLSSETGKNLRLFASRTHQDQSVKSGVPSEWYTQTRLMNLGPFYMQFGGWAVAVAAQSLVVDLNPRNLSAWVLIGARRLLGRRTLVWGHLHSRGGPNRRSAPLRRFMRQCSSGFIAYTPGEAQEALGGRRPVWVATNALYTKEQLQSSPTGEASRESLIYVGRLEPEKNVGSIVPAFAASALKHPRMALIVVGTGSEEASMRAAAAEFNVEERVYFEGWIDELARLRDLYGRSFASLSPGFAGLSLTQSLGFGVPQLVSAAHVHSPEIELADQDGAVTWIDAGGGSNSADSREVLEFARAIELAYLDRARVPLKALQQYVARSFSAESMAQGISDALLDRNGVSLGHPIRN